jgi:hypothetical protein
MLDAKTFGTSPAALFLTLLLNERGNKALSRKITKLVASVRRTLNELEFAHSASTTVRITSASSSKVTSNSFDVSGSALSLPVYSSLLQLVKSDIKARIKQLSDATADEQEKFIYHIVENVLVGEVRIRLRRVNVAVPLQKKLQRESKEGESVPRAIAKPFAGEPDHEHFQEKSKKYLSRHNKINTLY